ncbi:MAG: hypothetical protein A4E31_00978 [Methanomassiliicoccales archaeon PtaU1.Bin030]|nr:MAG: hypothetical protein A4E31_00978 [Methanomassiliicoccales archaeon PtaU1.Bin030]
MVSRVRVDMTICAHKALIDAHMQDDSTVKVRIRSTCREVRRFGKMIKPLHMEEYISIRDSGIMELAHESNLTPTCLVPAGVFNAVWMEAGLISKRYAQNSKSICVIFEE